MGARKILGFEEENPQVQTYDQQLAVKKNDNVTSLKLVQQLTGRKFEKYFEQEKEYANIYLLKLVVMIWT